MSSESQPGTTVARLLDAVGDAVRSSAGDLDVPVVGLAILDPDDEPGSYPHQLVLVIGVRDREAVRYVRTAARRGASAVAAKAERTSGIDELRAAAAETGVALVAVHPQVRWDHLEALFREVLDGAALPDDEQDGDLFALAETVAVLASGSVSIEDAGHRVLAYSRSSDDVDELRRLSILGRHGPEQYLSLLREWGVFERLRTSDRVVRVDEHPELGIRQRLAIGIRAGTRYLGTIWVQESAKPLAESADTALVGAARIAAVHLLGRRGSGAAADGLVADLLAGTASADLLAGRLGLDPASTATVVAFAVSELPGDLPTQALNQAQLERVIAVHATSYRHDALVGTVGSRTYAVLPGLPRGTGDRGVRAMATEAAVVTRNRTGVRVQAGIGSTAASLADVTTSRQEADRTLDAMTRAQERTVASISDLRTQVLLGETLDLLEANPQIRVPAVERLLDHDERRGTDLAPSLLAYLEALGDVRSAARELHVHPNTLRHRVRRASAVGDTDLADAEERLLCQLHLVFALRHRKRR